MYFSIHINIRQRQRKILSTKLITSIYRRNLIFDDVRTCSLYQTFLKPVCCASKLITSHIFIFASRLNLSWGKVKVNEAYRDLVNEINIEAQLIAINIFA